MNEGSVLTNPEINNGMGNDELSDVIVSNCRILSSLMEGVGEECFVFTRLHSKSRSQQVEIATSCTPHGIEYCRIEEI